LTNPHDTHRSLPDHPNLRHLKNQAKDLLRTGHAESLTDAQYKIACLYGFASWPKLKAHVVSLEEIGQLKLAIDRNDIERVKALMLRNPALHHAPLGYGKDGPLTWAAECRIPYEPPSPGRLLIAQWMIENGSDVHQGGDGPLMRAALKGDRIPMMELLVRHGANVNAEWHGYFPIIFAACETVDGTALKWLINQGANPNCADPERKYPGTALDYVIGSYWRSAELIACIDLLLEAGGVTKYDVPSVLDILCGRLDSLVERLDADPELLNRRFPELDFGSTAARRLLLRGTTLLHVAAEYGNVGATRSLLDRGADVNAPANVDESGVGGQTPIFHAATQFNDWGFPVMELLLERGADLSLQVKLPGHYERPDEVVDSTPLGYAMLFPGGETKTTALLRKRGGVI
jgi:ankyrin repeat protein